MKEAINLIYPVGRTIICDHSPQTDYPWQTWVQDLKDVFPLGAGDTYAAGATGGEAQHKLVESELPGSTVVNRRPTKTVAIKGVTRQTFSASTNDWYFGAVQDFYAQEDFFSNAPYNNMPPYKAVKYWTRTA